MAIDSRAALAAALRSGDAAIRRGVLTALGQAFEQAQGRRINPAALDELYRCYADNGLERTGCASLLLRLPNRYSLAIARHEFTAGTHRSLQLQATPYIARLPQEERIRLLSPLVLDAANATRCRAAANLLDDCAGQLAPGVALRVALISDHDLPCPELNGDSLAAWLTELQGPYPRKTRAALARQGAQAIRHLLAAWSQLPPTLQAWTLGQAARHGLREAGGPIRQLLRTADTQDLLVAALQCGAELALLEDDEVRPFCRHPVPRIRQAAIASGRELDWVDLLAAETAESVQQQLLMRLAQRGEAQYLPLFRRYLGSPNWRVRACARDALVSLAPVSLPTLQAALRDQDERVRTGAANALACLGQQALLCQTLQAL